MYYFYLKDIGSLPKIATVFVQEKTGRLFEHVTDPSMNTTCAKELIRALNQIIKCVTISVREKLIKSGCTIHLYVELLFIILCKYFTNISDINWLILYAYVEITSTKHTCSKRYFESATLIT